MYKLGCFDDEKGQFENIKNKIRRNNKELELCWIQGSSSIQDIVKEVCQKKVDVLLIDYEMAKVFGFNSSKLASRMNDYISDLSCFLLTQVEEDDEAIQEEVNNSIWHSESAAFVLLIPLEEMAISLMPG